MGIQGSGQRTFWVALVFFLSLFGALIWLCAPAKADITDPQIPSLLPVHCGYPKTDFVIAGQDSGGYFGRVYQSTSCSTGGRGTKPRKYSACADVTWDFDGALLTTEVLSTSVGTSVPGPSACFGAP